MYAKMFWLVSAVFVGIGALLLVTGSFTAMVGVVYGFLAFGLVFMGMISVLPVWMTHSDAAAKPVRSPARKLDTVSASSEKFRTVRSDVAA